MNRAVSFVSLTAITWALVTFVTAPEAHAYLDPGSLGMVLQVVVAAIAGGFMFFKTGWTRVKDLLSKISGRKPKP
jgi:hypothetical protein